MIRTINFSYLLSTMKKMIGVENNLGNKMLKKIVQRQLSGHPFVFRHQMRMFSNAKITAPAPAFSGMAWTEGTFKQVSLSDFAGKYVVLFFYPLDFTFVCPTEICAFNDAADEFKGINCELIACSVDSQFTHMEYTKKPRSEGGLGEMSIPMLSDITKQISKDYGVLTPDDAISFRGTFIIDTSGILRHLSINDLPVGRNPAETLRLVKAF